MPETINAFAVEPYSYAEARALSEELGLSEPVAVTLVRRGYRTPEQFTRGDRMMREGNMRASAMLPGRPECEQMTWTSTCRRT